MPAERINILQEEILRESALLEKERAEESSKGKRLQCVLPFSEFAKGNLVTNRVLERTLFQDPVHFHVIYQPEGFVHVTTRGVFGTSEEGISVPRQVELSLLLQAQEGPYLKDEDGRVQIEPVANYRLTIPTTRKPQISAWLTEPKSRHWDFSPLSYNNSLRRNEYGKATANDLEIYLQFLRSAVLVPQTQ